MAIRTWLLSSDEYLAATVHPLDGPDLADGDGVYAIELEPVLDLLERWVDGGAGDAPHDTVELLREHGRLSANDHDRRDGTGVEG